MKFTEKDYDLIQDLISEYYDLHPQLRDVDYDDEEIPFEYVDGYISYDSFGPTKVKQINHLLSVVNSLR
ncbi:hypothetical protein [Enterococcus olivae]